MQRSGGWLTVIIAAVALVGCGARPRTHLPPPAAKLSARQSRAAREQPAFRLNSSAFVTNQQLPTTYTADGDGVSPPLAWTAPPEGTKELALIMFDSDAPGGVFYHWSLYGLDPQTKGLPDSLPKVDTLHDPAALQGLNSAEEIGYYPPSPPSGKVHHYTFRLYALKSASGLEARATPDEVVKAVDGRVLAQADLVGTYQR